MTCDCDLRQGGITNIGEQFGRFQLPGSSLERVVHAISDGEFNTKFLAYFGDTVELWDSCLRAITELSDEPFLGRLSSAKVMARAMELMREMHNLNAPRGWYPAIKRLRAHSTSTPMSSRNEPGSSDCNASREEEEYNRWQREFDEGKIPPADVLTDIRSGVRAIDCEAAERLNEDPAMRDAFVRVAEQRRVPKGWGPEALDFLNAVELPKPSADLTRMRDRMAKYIAGEPWD